jgi:hypothetical protein
LRYDALPVAWKHKESIVLDQEIAASEVKADRFPFPCEGDITLAVRNANYALGR